MIFFFQINNIKFSAYDADWVGAPISFQRSILVITTATTRDFTFTAGKFIPINNETLMSVSTGQVGLGGLGVRYLPRDPRFAGSKPAEVMDFFQDVKILSVSPPGVTLS